MTVFNYKSGYVRKLEISFISSLCLVILLFYFSPVLRKKRASVKYNNYPELIIIDIPQTRQNRLRIPKPSEPIIPVAADEIDFLSDIKITADSTLNTSFDEIGAALGITSNLPFQPRQILEVLPENVAKSVKGEIVFSLLIGQDGKVKRQKLISNTTNCRDCLNSVLAAVTKSRWQPIKLRGEKTEYWIRKAYIFD